MEIVTANEKSVEIFAGVLIEAAEWLNLYGNPMWKVRDLTAEELLKKYSLNEMKLCYDDGKLIGVYVLQWHDPLFWPEMGCNDSGYLHKLAVRSEYKGRKYGNKLIQSAELICRENNKRWLRLNCGTLRPRLRNFYGNAGFEMVDRVFIDNRDQIRYQKKLV
jgi:N-acetylglutamate synthase and related acetyltransferases